LLFRRERLVVGGLVLLAVPIRSEA
jgi:hypothetical protein